MSETRLPGRIGFGAVLLAVAVPIVPLFVHRSSYPAFGPYSPFYAAFLAVVTAAAVLFAIGVARSCARRGSVRPARIAVLGVVAVCVAAVLGEILAGFVVPDPFAEYRRWGQRKSIVFGFENDRDFRWTRVGALHTTDALGFRTHVSDPDWADGTGSESTRMFTIGGSSVFGFGLDDDETWSHLLEARLRENLGDPDLLVINAGNNGHNSLMTLLRFYLRVLPHRPTHVVYYQARNDVRDRKVSIDDVQASEQVLFSETLTDYLKKHYPRGNLYYRTNLGHLVNATLGRWKDAILARRGELAEEHGPTEAERAIHAHNGAAFVRNIRTLSDLCRRHGIRLILTTFAYDPDIRPASSGRGTAHYNDLLRRLARDEGLALIELETRAHAAPNTAEWFCPDGYHPSREGARAIAEVLARDLAGMIQLEPARSSDPRETLDGPNPAVP